MSGPTLWMAPDEAARRVLVDRLRADGWHPFPGFGAPRDAWQLGDRGLVLHGTVRHAADGRNVAVALTRGASAAVVLACDRGVRLALLDDAQRVGRVIELPGEEPDRPRLTAEQRRLLELLAGGESLVSAAAQLYLSVRTAERRLREARRLLGAGTTAEAVSRAGALNAGIPIPPRA